MCSAHRQLVMHVGAATRYSDFLMESWRKQRSILPWRDLHMYHVALPEAPQVKGPAKPRRSQIG